MSNLPAVTPAPSTSGGAPADISAFNNDVGYLVASDPEFTEFKATAVGEILAFGITINTTSATAFLPIASRTKAVSLIITGSFELFSRTSGVIATGITAANLGIIQNRSSNRIVSLNITGLSTTGGIELELRSASADASIKVNF